MLFYLMAAAAHSPDAHHGSHFVECSLDEDWDEEALIQHHGPDFRRRLTVGPTADMCSYESNTPDPQFSAVANDVYLLRMVVHLTAAGTSYGDFSDHCVHDAIERLNNFLRGGSGGVDSKIEVRLTNTNEKGEPAGGIRRYYDPSLVDGSDGARRRDILKAVQWDPERFLNVVSFSGDPTINGLATLPASSGRHTIGDSVRMSTAIFTECSESPSHTTFAHEIGHCTQPGPTSLAASSSAAPHPAAPARPRPLLTRHSGPMC